MRDRYWIPEYTGSRAGWPVLSVPVSGLIGLTTEQASRLCDAEGFGVQVFDHEIHEGWDLDLAPGRIRLHVHRGQVKNASQG